MLLLKRIGIDTYREHVAFLRRDCPEFRPEDFLALGKVQVSAGDRTILATLNIVDAPGLLDAREIGLSQAAFQGLGVAEGTSVAVSQAISPASLESVRRKIHGDTLEPPEVGAIVRDIAAMRYSKMEIAAFLIASARFLTTGEIMALTRSMAEVGDRLTWEWPIVADKHSIGGIPGNRTSMVIVPIVAAHGLPIPKTSSRAITSPAGTADTMEVLAKVDLDADAMRAVVERTGGCLVWGGHVNLSPADDVLISVERPLGVDTQEQMVASILSKKLAAGSTHLLLDIPLGPTAKVRSRDEAIRLRKLVEHVADRVGLVVDVAITDGRQPIGCGVGPVLEARDVMAVLRNDPAAPADLREKALHLAGRIIDFDPALRGGRGSERAAELLRSGAALATMERIIDAQGRVDVPVPVGPLVEEVRARRAGVVESIDCYRIARIARMAGAPLDRGAGVDLRAKIGTAVRAGDPLYRIHACISTGLGFAVEFAAIDDGFKVT